MIVIEYDFQDMRRLLTEYGIAAPESDEDLGDNWDSYVSRLKRKIKRVEDD